MVITEDKPGRMIALAVTELQERAVVDVEIIPMDGLVATATVADNKLKITIGLNLDYDSGAAGDGLPAGGQQYQVLQRASGGNAVWDWVRATVWDSATGSA